MRHTFLGLVFLVLAVQLAMAGVGTDQPTNITVTTPYSNNYNWAQFCWNTTKTSDSMVLIGQNQDFSRWVYDGTLTTSHCVVVKNLQQGTQYYYSVASCTDPVGGKPCARTDANWSTAPWPSDVWTFTTKNTSSGPMAFTAQTFGPNYVYQGSGINVGVTLTQTSGLLKDSYAMLITEASIDGVSCLPGTLLGAACGNTGITLTMLCDGRKEQVAPQSNNYPVYVMNNLPYKGDYVCWNGYFGEPGMDARIVATGGQTRQPTRGPSNQGHILRLMFQMVDISQGSVAITEPLKMTYIFTVMPPPAFTVTPPTSFPPIPNWNNVVFNAAVWGTDSCKVTTDGIAAGKYLNANFSAAAANLDPWDSYTYDGNRVFKQIADWLDGTVGGQWQPNHSYNPGDLIVVDGYEQVNYAGGKSGSTQPSFNPAPGGFTPDWGTTWRNAANRDYYTKCSELVGMQYLNWAVNVPKWVGTDEWNIFPWGMYMDYLRQGDVLNENCNGSQTCSGLNQTANWRFGANIVTYPAQGFTDENFVLTYYQNQTGTVRALPYNMNMLLVDWLETGTLQTNEFKARLDLLLQSISQVISYNPLDGPGRYVCCYSAPNYNVGLWAMTLINTYNVQTYMGVQPDSRIPIELMKLLDWFYSTQVNLLNGDNTFPYEPFTIPYNCQLFSNNDCKYDQGGLNNLVSPAYAWLGAVYGDSCKLPTSGMKCWDAADLLFTKAFYDGYQGTAKNYNQLFQDFSNYVGWRTGTMAGTDSYVLPAHNPPGDPYPDVMGPYPAGAFPAKPSAGNISNSGAVISWYTYEQAVNTVVKVGTDPRNLNMETDCGPSVYTGMDNLWINTCSVSNLNANTVYYFGVGGTDAANNYAFSAVDPTNNLYGDWFNFKTGQ